MSHSAIITEVEALLDRIDVPFPFDLEELCRRLGAMWGSTVVLFPTETLPYGPCGIWVSLEREGELFDVFAYEKAAPPWHQAQVVFHEIGHRALGHARLSDGTWLARQLMPSLNPDVVSRVLGCARDPAPYDADTQELHAEYFGTRLLDRVYGWKARPLPSDAPPGLVHLHAALTSGHVAGGASDG